MIKKIKISLILLFAFFINIEAQIQFPPKGIVFDDEQVNRIDIVLDADSLDILLEPGNEESFHEFPASFIFTNNNNADTIENVGFRLRGNTSRNSEKKSFKISFNTFENNKYEGFEKLNINGEHNDPSIARSKICWDICNNFEVISSRCNHVELYINSEYKGLYINVEHIDEEFIELRFGNKTGNLYKCLWPADLNFKGSDPDLYKENLYGRRTYDLKTNTNIDDYSDLANFIDILNNTSINNLPTELENVLNVPGYLRYQAIEIFLGHWDGYAYNKNNFYLYNDPETNLFNIIAYDLDNTIGIDWMGRDWATRDINDWASHGEDRPLIEQIMQVDEYKAWFNFYISKLMNQETNENILFPKIDSIKSQIKNYVVNDTYHSMDYGYSYTDFLNSFFTNSGGHVTYGIKPYFTNRLSTASQQLDLVDINPIISNVRNNHPGAQQLVNIIAKVEDENLVETRLFYSDNQQNWSSVIMLDNGEMNDKLENDEYFGINIGTFNAGVQIDYYIEAEDNLGKISRFPRSSNKSLVIKTMSPVSLAINEFMAKNSNTISDQNGNFDDWIEIMNIGNSPVFLGDKYLSDNINQPTKWQMPDTTIAPGEYFLVWADNEENEGENHTNFKLSANGEEIIIVDTDGSTLIDYVKYYWQSEDFSNGRFPNATGISQLLGFATPGSANILMDIKPIDLSENVRVFPNPFIDNCKIDIPNSLNQEKRLEVFSVDGKLVFEKSFTEEYYLLNSNSFDNLFHKSGIYFLRISNTSTKNVCNRKIVKL